MSAVRDARQQHLPDIRCAAALHIEALAAVASTRPTASRRRSSDTSATSASRTRSSPSWSQLRHRKADADLLQEREGPGQRGVRLPHAPGGARDVGGAHVLSAREDPHRRSLAVLRADRRRRDRRTIRPCARTPRRSRWAAPARACWWSRSAPASCVIRIKYDEAQPLGAAGVGPAGPGHRLQGSSETVDYQLQQLLNTGGPSSLLPLPAVADRGCPGDGQRPGRNIKHLMDLTQDFLGDPDTRKARRGLRR